MNTPSTNLNRREFVKAISAAGLGLTALGALPVSAAPAATSLPSRRKRYVIVGVGGRHRMYRNAIQRNYAEHAELVGICDLNPGRLELAQNESRANGAPPPPAYVAADFDRMIRETSPDHVIVTTVDATHDDYIVRALEAGVDVITEKPMTTTAAKCQRILDAKARTGRKLRVTFNYRYSPPRTQVKDLLMNGAIGDIRSVDFHWMLNTHHGADYFRRWHSQKANSGGLLVHKATHHFDLVNWWLGAMPMTVFANGKREFYTEATARRFGLRSHHERCLTCPEKNACSFELNLMKSADLKSLYLDQEKHDGYFRDRCVWRPDIDIEDTMNALVTYENNITLAYSLNAFSAWEGYTIAFNGTQGRLEHSIVEQVYMSGVNAVQGGIVPGGVSIRVVPLRGAAQDLEPWVGTGGHGGGDDVMLDEIFLPSPPVDRYQRASDERGGSASILVGVAANRSIEVGQPVKIKDLVHGLSSSDYAPMPTRTGPLPMPKRILE